MCLKLAALGKNKSSFKWYVVITIVQRTFSDYSEMRVNSLNKKASNRSARKIRNNLYNHQEIKIYFTPTIKKGKTSLFLSKTHLIRILNEIKLLLFFIFEYGYSAAWFTIHQTINNFR